MLRYLPKPSFINQRGLTITELMVSLAISAISFAALMMVINDNQRINLANKSRSDSIVSTTIAMTMIERFFSNKSLESPSYCSSTDQGVQCDENASYCLCDCVADESTKANQPLDGSETCNTLYIRQKDPLYRTTGYTEGYDRELIVRATCQQAGQSMAEYKFESSCNLDCQRGFRPVVFIQKIFDDNIVLDQRIPVAADQELIRSRTLAASFCAQRNSAAEGLGITMYGYSYNGDDDDKNIQYFRKMGTNSDAKQLFPKFRLLEEQPFPSSDVMVVAE